jgi:hypothetical protein
VYGNSVMKAGALTFSRRITRSVDLDVSAGAIHMKTTGTQRVDLSPEVAALLGRTSGVEAFVRRGWIPQIAATLGYALERSRFTVAYTSGVSPGNGVFLTSQRNALSSGYSFTGVRKLSLGASARYTRSISKSIVIRDLTTIGGGGGINYALTRLINLSTQFDYRSYRTGGIPGREGFFLSFGLSVSPARIPLSIW